MVLARPYERDIWPYHCSLRLFTMVRSSCGPIACWILAQTFSLVTWSFVWDAYYLAVAPHFHGLYSSLKRYCEGTWFTSIQEDRCDKGAHQSYLGTERDTPVTSNWFQSCQCCCCLCYIISWTVSQAWNPHQLQLSPDTWSLWLSQASIRFTLISVLMPVVLSSAWSSRHWSPYRWEQNKERKI